MRTLSVLLLAFVCSEAVAYAEPWELLSDEEGIKVWQRSVPGSSFVEFRGRGVVPANFKRILAVLRDNKRKTEWMESCSNNKLIRWKGPGNGVMYNRTGSSFPLVDDRDVVVESAVDIVKSRHLISIDAWNVNDPAMPEVDGVVRMPKLQANWKLKALGKNRTLVTYQVQADPGGWLPAWVVNMASSSMPYKTIRNLRRQVKKSGYVKDLAYVEAAFDWSNFLPKSSKALTLGPSDQQ